MKARLTAVLLVASLGVGSPAVAAPRNTRFESVRAPVRLVPAGEGTTSIEGLHSFSGRLRLSAAADGIVVVNRLPLERYLLGLEEVPRWWPRAAEAPWIWWKIPAPAGSMNPVTWPACAAM